MDNGNNSYSIAKTIEMFSAKAGAESTSKGKDSAVDHVIPGHDLIDIQKRFDAKFDELLEVMGDASNAAFQARLRSMDQSGRPECVGFDHDLQVSEAVFRKLSDKMYGVHARFHDALLGLKAMTE